MKLDYAKLDYFIKKILALYLGLIFIFTCVNSLYDYLTHHAWNYGDWLINYQGGFVRRGLTGEVAYILSQKTPFNPGQFIFILHELFYGTFFYFSYQLLKKQKTLLPFILLIFSPFIFLFQINLPSGGFRKEIIYFALLAVTVWASYLNKQTFEKIFFIILLGYPFALLSHEMLLVFLPYLFAVYFLNIQINLKKMVVLSLFIIPSLTACYFCIQFKGNADIVEKIYHSLAIQGYPIKNLEQGTITWLGKSTTDGFNFVIERIQTKPLIRNTIIALLLILLAFLPLYKSIISVFKNKFALVMVLASFSGTIILSVVAIDWGRWLYIQAVSIFLLLLVKQPTNHLIAQGTDENLSVVRKINIHLFLVFTLIYSMSWSIHHTLSIRFTKHWKQVVVIKPLGTLKKINQYNDK